MDKLIKRDKAILEYLTYKYGKKIVDKMILEIKQNKNNIAI
jgi:hypothetical protein